MKTKTIVCFALLAVVQTISAANLRTLDEQPLSGPKSIAFKTLEDLMALHHSVKDTFEWIGGNYNRAEKFSQEDALSIIDGLTAELSAEVDKLKNTTSADSIDISNCMAEFEPQLPNGANIQQVLKDCAEEADKAFGMLMANEMNKMEKLANKYGAFGEKFNECEEVDTDQCYIDAVSIATAMKETWDADFNKILRDYVMGTQQILEPNFRNCSLVRFDQYKEKKNVVLKGLTECIDKL